MNLEHLKDPHGSIGNSMHIPNVGAVMKKEKIKEAQTTGNYDDYDEFQPFNGRSPGSNTWRYVLKYHILGPMLWGYSLSNQI